MRTPRHPKRPLRGLALAALAAVAGCGGAPEPDATVAVATNFADVAARLVADYEAAGGGRLRLVSGSTGQLYAQIVAGAPYDAFLAADDARPRRLEADGLAVPGRGFVYAVGRLVLYSAEPGRIAADGAAVLRAGGFRRLAMANPELAPYGAAARETLASLGLLEALAEQVVLGENIGQAYALVATGNAELGFVALAQLAGSADGSRWPVPAALHRPIAQRAVLLARAADNRAASGFLDFLCSPAARAVIVAAGYGPPDSPCPISDRSS